MSNPMQVYLNTLKQSLATGAATEHTHRPALAALLESLAPGVKAINEPKRIACGAPDLAVLRNKLLVGHVEAKGVGIPLDAVERSPQLKRYREALDNLILTDYLEFRRYVGGELRDVVRLARWDGATLRPERDGPAALDALLADFLAHAPQPLATPRALAERLARLTHLIREMIVAAFAGGRASETLRGWREAFAKVLIADLDKPENVGQFADMFAQTLAYGLFSARVMQEGGRSFDRQAAQNLIPKTNPFLRKFFYHITGPELDDEPYAGFVEDLVQVLAHADMGAILADFGKRTRQDDPTVHFYETFLAAYDPALREQRGVYYTPTPVVGFIVRSVDALLKSRFGLPGGLADRRTVEVGGKTLPKVLILDPATGTGTFPYAVIDLIRQRYMQQDNAGLWSGFVRQDLLPRICGFELLMAPYAVAHFKLAFQLAGYDLPEAQRAAWAYDFGSDGVTGGHERLGIYLTNALETVDQPVEGLWGPLRMVTDEAQQANRVKGDYPIMVILGNPPYAVSSSNQGAHITGLMERYKAAVRGERNLQPLSDDYIKFIRFAHDRIERTGHGVLGFITNHSYLAGLIHRGMREELLKSFDEIYIVDLHGNALLGETAPDGGKEENVFDIRQGVAIAIFVKTTEGEGNSLATVYHADLWGRRANKYCTLNAHDVETLTWEQLEPVAPYYFFVPKDFSLQEEYAEGWLIEDVFNSSATGTGTGCDAVLVDFEQQPLRKLAQDLTNPKISDEELTRRYTIVETSGWNFYERRALVLQTDLTTVIHPYHYRPFDIRFVLYAPLIRRDSRRIMWHMQQDNLGLLLSQQQAVKGFRHVFCTRHIVDESAISTTTRERGFVFPLYLYPNHETHPLLEAEANGWQPDPEHDNRVPNLSHKFVQAVEEKLGLPFHPIQNLEWGIENLEFGPEDVLAYIYAFLHSPAYRERYAEFLKIDFPRVPLTGDPELFWQLVALGRELIALHLLEAPALAAPGVNFPVNGDNTVAAQGGYPKYTPPNPEQGLAGRVHINKTQYFNGVPPEAWEFQVGGYQVLHKWLKDRRGRVLTTDELMQYPQIVAALRETIRLMDELDAAISAWPIS